MFYFPKAGRNKVIFLLDDTFFIHDAEAAFEQVQVSDRFRFMTDVGRKKL